MLEENPNIEHYPKTYLHKCVMAKVSSDIWDWLNNNIGYANYEWNHVVENHNTYYEFQFTNKNDMTRFYLTWG